MIDFSDDNDWSANWLAFDRFVREWLNTTFIRNSESTEIDTLERSAGIRLSASAREWCAFALASPNLDHFSWRDCLVVEPVRGNDAVSLLIQGEADYYWAIETENLSLPDPPVIGYGMDYDSNETAFEKAGMWAPTVTAFALDYFLSYLHSPGGGFSVRLSSKHFDQSKLLAEFGPPVCFGHLKLFHLDGVLVVMGGLPPSWRHEVISVEIQTKRPFNRLPQLVQSLAKDAHVTHGGLHEYR
ncbi:MAG: hypothetical protein U0941_13365 [Planctomycetaceae bacterium]